MAWGDLAKVGELLASLGSLGKDAERRKGKSGGKSGKGGSASLGKKFCHWAGCNAAEKHQATLGGAAQCHSCRRPFAQTPPLERLVEWAYKEKLKASPTVSKGGGKSQKGLGKDEGNAQNGAAAANGKGKDKVEPTAEELKKLRDLRMAELKGPRPAPETLQQAHRPSQQRWRRQQPHLSRKWA